MKNIYFHLNKFPSLMTCLFFLTPKDIHHCILIFVYNKLISILSRINTCTYLKQLCNQYKCAITIQMNTYNGLNFAFLQAMSK